MARRVSPSSRDNISATVAMVRKMMVLASARLIVNRREPVRSGARYPTLGETLPEPLSLCHSPRYLAEREGVHVEDNDAEVYNMAGG
jgi:hypothetical protein